MLIFVFLIGFNNVIVCWKFFSRCRSIIESKLNRFFYNLGGKWV